MCTGCLTVFSTYLLYHTVEEVAHYILCSYFFNTKCSNSIKDNCSQEGPNTVCLATVPLKSQILMPGCKLRCVHQLFSCPSSFKNGSSKYNILVVIPFNDCCLQVIPSHLCLVAGNSHLFLRWHDIQYMGRGRRYHQNLAHEGLFSYY